MTIGVMNTALTADCLIDVSPPNPVAMTLEIASGLVGGTHTGFVTIRDEGVLIEGELVEITISGPNARAVIQCDPVDCHIERNGIIRFSYTSNGDKGVDEIQTMSANYGGSNMLRMIWVLDDCNANGVPDICDIDCTGYGGLCNQFIGCGTSSDLDGDGCPDECKLPKKCGYLDRCKLEKFKKMGRTVTT